MTHITITISNQTTGAADDAEVTRYMNELEIALGEEFYGADISVTRNDRLSANTVECSINFDRNVIDGLVSRMWGNI